MFVRNRTGREVVCKRGTLEIASRGLSLRFANVMTADCYERLGSEAWRPTGSSDVPAELRTALTTTAWDGTSVTASGTVMPPGAGTSVQRVTLRVGEIRRTLVASGRRQWIRDAGVLVPGGARPWEPLTLCWSEAFGGSHAISAGRDAATGLPRPAHELRHAQNPKGKGFAPENLAEGLSLPRLELLEDPIRRLGDLPVPGCFAPCTPGLAGMTGPLPDGHPVREGSYDSVLAPSHLAPAYLIFPWLVPGAAVSLRGLEHSIDFRLPRPTLAVAVQSTRPVRQGVRLRVLHIDANQHRITCLWQHAVITERPILPDVEIVSRSSAQS